MGDFAADAGARYQLGCSRGDRSQFNALGVTRDAFLAEIGLAIDRVILNHATALAFEDSSAVSGPNAAFRLRRSADDPKSRWVDGTPEYSMHICALHAMFPAAKFVHIVRSSGDVIASMLNFHRLAGHDLVKGPADAYAYWYKSVRACLLAEEALGKDVVHRLRYADLVADPKAVLTQILSFLGEKFEPACLEPLTRRINSSGVPSDFRVDASAVDSELLQRVALLDRALQHPLPPIEPSSQALQQFEEVFEGRIRSTIDFGNEQRAANHDVQRMHQELEEYSNWANELNSRAAEQDLRIVRLHKHIRALFAFVAVNLSIAVAVFFEILKMDSRGAAGWTVVAVVGMGVGLWVCRKGLMRALGRLGSSLFGRSGYGEEQRR